MIDIEDFRREVDEFMGRHPQSPLDRAQQRGFTGLNYYEPDPDYVFEVDVTLLPEDEPPVQMQTSTGAAVDYRRWGQFEIEVGGAKGTLTIYSDAHGHELFLPFRDATSAIETYEAGRYLDDHRPGLRRLPGNRLEIDFNYAYNPYCAYTDVYSCPLPPFENWLKLPIRAGEKAYK